MKAAKHIYKVKLSMKGYQLKLFCSDLCMLSVDLKELGMGNLGVYLL